MSSVSAFSPLIGFGHGSRRPRAFRLNLFHILIVMLPEKERQDKYDFQLPRSRSLSRDLHSTLHWQLPFFCRWCWWRAIKHLARSQSSTGFDSISFLLCFGSLKRHSTGNVDTISTVNCISHKSKYLWPTLWPNEWPYEMLDIPPKTEL